MTSQSRKFQAWMPGEDLVRSKRESFHRHQEERKEYRLDGADTLYLIVRPARIRVQARDKWGDIVYRYTTLARPAAPGELHDVPRLFGRDPLVLRRDEYKGSPYAKTIPSIPVFSDTSKMNAPSFSMLAGMPSAGGMCAAARLQFDDVRVPICWTCYALKGRYPQGNVLAVQIGRRAWTLRRLRARTAGVYSRNALAEDLIQSLYSYIEVHPRSIDPHYFRAHDSGDFGEHGELAEVWNEVARHFQRGDHKIRFWAPTREWLFLPSEAGQLGLRPLPGLRDAFYPESQGGHRPENFVLRPSAFHHGDPPPQVPGLDAGTTCTMPDFYNRPYPRVPRCQAGDRSSHCHCAAYEKGNCCNDANCRTCWDYRHITVDYPYH